MTSEHPPQPPDPKRPAEQPHLSTLLLHQLRYGELEPTAMQAARAHVDGCPRCRSRLSAQQANRSAFEVRPMPAALRDLPSPSIWRRLVRFLQTDALAVPGLAVAAALLLLVVAAPQSDEHDPLGPDVVRSKGSTEVELIREGEGVMEAGASVQAGDRIQVRVPAGPYSEAWVGDSEQVLGHFELQPEKATLAPFALTIDDEPGAESLTVILSEAPLARSEAEGYLKRQTTRNTPPSGVRIQRLYLPKERSR
jgi:hypothetical protein